MKRANEIQDIGGQNENTRKFINNVNKAIQHIQRESDVDHGNALKHIKMLNLEISNFLHIIHDIPGGVSKHLINNLKQLQTDGNKLMTRMVQRSNQ